MRRVPTRAAQLAPLIGVALAEAHGAPVLSLHPTTLTVVPGGTVFVNVSATGITNLYAFQFDLRFVPGLLVADSVDEGAFLQQGGTTLFDPGRIDNSTGAIQMTIGTRVGPVSGVSGDGPLVGVSFRALGPGMSAITLSRVILLDSQLQEIIATTTE